MAIGRKVSPAKFIGAVAGVVGGVSNIIGGRRAAKQARKQQRAAQRRLDKRISEFEGLDTSNIYADVRNPYENISMENVYEDLTVNQQQAQFEAQQFQQSQANIMANLQGAAGGSGVAALAQTLANQGQIAAQQSAASIGAQEAANQQLMAQGAADVLAREQMKAKGASDALMTRLSGEEASRKAEAEKVEALMGLESGRLTSANEALAAARQRTSSGFGQILGGVAGGLAGGIGGKIVKGIGGKIGSALGQTKIGGALGKLAAAGGAKIGETPGFMSGAARGLLDRMKQEGSGATVDDIKKLTSLFGIDD